MTKIEIPNSINAATIRSVFKARKAFKYTDKQLGEAIALYDLMEQFMKESGMCSSTLHSIRREQEALHGFKSNRERH